jgi:hypothetical protein
MANMKAIQTSDKPPHLLVKGLQVLVLDAVTAFELLYDKLRVRIEKHLPGTMLQG